MKVILTVGTAVLLFISQQSFCQTDSPDKNKSYRSLPDSSQKKLFKQLKMDSCVSKMGNILSEDRPHGFYNLMPMMKPDPNFKDNMPHYSPPEGFHSNMPVVPFVYENEKQNSWEIKIKK